MDGNSYLFDIALGMSGIIVVHALILLIWIYMQRRLRFFWICAWLAAA